MPDLPPGNHAFYAGIDPGFRGAVGVMNAAGTTVKVWDIPICRSRTGIKEYDLASLKRIFRHLKLLPDCVVGIEWPTTRPGEGAERSERFGRGKGYLESFAFLFGLSYFKIAPNLWKGRLGLPGKDDPAANRLAAEFFTTYYPNHRPLILGVRGGLLDGRADALLIAHFLRLRTVGAMRSVVERWGKDSVQAQALILGAGRKKKSRGT